MHADGREKNLAQFIVDVGEASAGLLALALTLSVIIGPSLGLVTARTGAALVPGRLYATISRLDNREGALAALGERRP